MAKSEHTWRRHKLLKKRGRKLGSPPGTLIHVGEARQTTTRIQRIRYDEEHLDEQEVLATTRFVPPDRVTETLWIDIDGLHDAEVIRQFGEDFGIHPLVLEDIINTDQRPKIEAHEDYTYVVLKMLQYDEVRQGVRIEQVSLVIGNNYLLSFQETQDDVFDSVRLRLRSGRRIRQRGPDYLAYALIDAIVDDYFALLERLSDAIESLEDEVISRPSPETLTRIHHLRREMLLVRKAIWPIREVLSTLSRDDSLVLRAETRLHLRDVYDHSIHIIENIEIFRDLLSGMLDLYISSVSQRMNEIMKTLTIFASIFMPLTFLAGVYGMNFHAMPELAWRWGYPLILAIMLAIGGGLIFYFRWRRWF